MLHKKRVKDFIAFGGITLNTNETGGEASEVVRKCRRCGFETTSSAFKCVECGGELTPKGSFNEADGQKDWTSRTIEGGVRGLFGCIAIVVVVIGGTGLLLSQCSNKPAATDQPEANTNAAASDTPDETEIVTECDLTVKSSLTSESAYDPEFGWKYTVTGNQAEVMRKFEATTGFNAKLTYGYTCRYDWRRKRITFLQIVGPYGSRTLVGKQ